MGTLPSSNTRSATALRSFLHPSKSPPIRHPTKALMVRRERSEASNHVGERVEIVTLQRRTTRERKDGYI